MNELNLNFYSVKVKCISSWDKLLEYLRKDFSFFVEDSSGDDCIELNIFKEGPPWHELNGLKASGQSVNSVTYHKGSLKFNDYYSEVLTVFDKSSKLGRAYSQNFDKVHEVVYLWILSLTGRRLDISGLHKIHAFGVSLGQVNLVGMMPMKGGKSSLFLELLKNDETQIISDDSPLVNWRGQLFPFPLRVGIEPKDRSNLPSGNNELLYEIHRSLYGKKLLIPLAFFKKAVSKCEGRTVLLEGIREFSDDCQIEKISRLKMFGPLMRNMVVGMGLPMVLEHFLDFNLLDFVRLGRIFLSRLRASLILLLKSQTYRIYLGRDRKKNAETLLKLINHSGDKQ